MNVTPVFVVLAYAAVLASCQSLDKPTRCDSETCRNGQRCSMQIVQCFAPPCDPILACVDIPADQPYTGNEGVCEAGSPLLLKDSAGGLDEVTCGGVVNPVTCPKGFTCHTADNNAFAVCCQITVKPGHCPASLTTGIGICAEMCTNDSSCDGNSKCCSNGCGHVCAEPVVLCGKQQCPPGQLCAVRNVTCVMAPCDPVFNCVDISAYQPITPENPCEIGIPLLLESTSSGEATPVFCGRGPGRQDCPSNFSCLIALDDRYAVCCYDSRAPVVQPDRCPKTEGMVGICVEECSSDADCQGGLVCCSNGCGHTCREPTGSQEALPCGSTVCLPTERCSMFCATETCDNWQFACVPNTVPQSYNPCSQGRPLLLDRTGQISENFCGLNPKRVDCPSNYTCAVASDDRYAKCCYNPTVPAKCPAYVDEQMTDCKHTCAVDADCPSGKTCCRRSCGALVCATPDTSHAARATRDGAVLAALLSLWLAHFVNAFAY